MTGAFGPAPLKPPSAAELTRRRALETLKAGEHATAAALAQDALKLNPNDSMMLYALGWARVSMGDLSGGQIRLRQAIARNPSNVLALCAMAELHRMLQRPEEGIELCDRAIPLTTETRPMTLKATCLAELGRYEDAAAVVEERAKAEGAPLGVVVTYADLTDVLGRAEEGVELIRRALNRPTFEPTARQGAFYVLGRLLDKLGRYDEAFEAYSRANRMVTPQERFDGQNAIEQWSAEAMARIPNSRVRSGKPVLIVGMPRSGTTLLERIIAAHPKAAGVGESPLLIETAAKLDPANISQAEIDAIAKRYLEMLDREGSAKADRVVDKMPDNYQLLGVVAKALPDAKIIHCRRDPRDTCLSCFFQNFGPRHRYSADLVEVAHRYLTHLRMMDHWRSVTSLSIHEVRYEDLTSDPERTVRETLAFLGLAFDERCLEFHRSRRVVATASRDQVRQPLYKSSVARWERYKDHLEPMLEVLREGGAIQD